MKLSVSTDINYNIILILFDIWAAARLDNTVNVTENI